jgi:hypothetical protein
MNDEQLLEALRTAFAPAPAEPAPGAFRALHYAIDSRPARRRGRRPSMMRRWTVPALAVAITVGGSSAAFAAGAPLPRVVRQVAHAIGLPVDLPKPADARRHRSQLRTSLQRRDTDTVAHDAAKLRTDLNRLGPDEGKQLENGSDQLLEQADRRLAPSPPSPAGSPEPTPGSTVHNETPNAPGPSSASEPAQDSEDHESGATQQAPPPSPTTTVEVGAGDQGPTDAPEPSGG